MYDMDNARAAFFPFCSCLYDKVDGALTKFDEGPKCNQGS